MSLPTLPDPLTAHDYDFEDFANALRKAMNLETLEAILGFNLFFTMDRYDDIRIVTLIERTHKTQDYVVSLNTVLVSEEKQDRVLYIFFRDGIVEVRSADRKKDKEVLKTFSTWDEAYISLLDVIRDYLDQLKRAIPEEIPAPN